jgi:hypothetical protein
MASPPADFTIERENVPHDGNNRHRLATLPLKSNDQKNTGALDRIEEIWCPRGNNKEIFIITDPCS